MSTYNYEQLIEKLKFEKFSDAQSAQFYLNNLKISVVMAIRVTRSVFGISMGEAKKIVDSHPVWRSESLKGSEIQKNAIDVALKFEVEENIDDKLNAYKNDPTHSM